MKKEILKTESLVFIVLVLVIIAVAILVRTTMLQYYGFYEPDGFYYFTVITETVSNNFVMPQLQYLSGWPSHTPVAEAKGVYWVTLIPYAILRYFGVSYYTVMRLIPVVFGLLDVLGAYLISRYLSKDKFLGLLTMAFVALSMGDAARTSALIYRGDVFVTFPLLISIVLFIEVFKQDTEKRKAIFAAGAAIALLCANFVWNGSSFADATIMFAFIVLMVSAFIFRNEKLINDGKYILMSIIAWYILASAVGATGFIPGQQLVGPSFIYVYVALVAFWLIVYYVSNNILAIMRSREYRTAFILGGLILGLVAFYFAEPTIVYNVFVGNGFITPPGSFGSTIQELQPPSYSFIFTSFGTELYTSLPALAMSMTVLHNNIPSSAIYSSINSFFWSGYGILGIILLFICFIPYFFMQIYDSGGGFLKGNPRIHFSLNVPMAVIASYFVLTAYLQMHIIRFNSLVSIPIAILSAYTVYWLILYSLKASGKIKKFISFSAIIIVPNLLLHEIVLLGSNPIMSFITNILNYIILAISVIAIIAYYILMKSKNDEHMKLHWFSVSASAFFLIVVLSMLWHYGIIYANSLSQADSINPEFLGAMQWLGTNSPSNSVVLTLWPDGSVVEGVAHRISVTDSVGSQNATKADPYAAWLLSNRTNASFLESRINGKPDYLVARSTWLGETQGIYTEANITESPVMFGYSQLQGYSEQIINSTSRDLLFQINPGQQYPYLVLNIRTLNTSNSLSSMFAYVQYSANQIMPFAGAELYDQGTGAFIYTNQSKQFNVTNKEMMLVEYSDAPRPGFFINLTGGYVFAQGFAQSNMMDLLFLCNSFYCRWDNRNATLDPVYYNPDTRIYKIIYNSTSNYTSAANVPGAAANSIASNPVVSNSTGSNTASSNTV